MIAIIADTLPLYQIHRLIATSKIDATTAYLVVYSIYRYGVYLFACIPIKPLIILLSFNDYVNKKPEPYRFSVATKTAQD